MTPAERLKEIEELLSHDEEKLNFCIDREDVRFLLIRVKQLESALEIISATDSAHPETGPDLEWHRTWRHETKFIARKALEGE